MNSNYSKALFWGALWGIVEATAGFVVHRASIALPGLPGFVMFPLAFFFMLKAIQSTGNPASALLAALVAASVKLADFIVPGHDPLRILNPALSIILEGFAVYAISRYFGRKDWQFGLLEAFLMGFAWRAAFSIYLFAISRFGLPAALITDGPANTLRFLLLESAVNAGLIYLYLKSSLIHYSTNRFIPSPGHAMLALILAIAAHLAI